MMRELKKKVDITVGIHAEEGGQAHKEWEVLSSVDKKTGELKQRFRKGENKEGVTVADVASAAEFGIGQPQRAWCGGWVDGHEAEINEKMPRIWEPVAAGKFTAEQAAARFGLWVAGQMKKNIADGIDPPLSENRRLEKEAASGKAKDTPLIFTGQFRSSIRSKVTLGGGGEGHGH